MKILSLLLIFLVSSDTSFYFFGILLFLLFIIYIYYFILTALPESFDLRNKYPQCTSLRKPLNQGLIYFSINFLYLSLKNFYLFVLFI